MLAWRKTMWEGIFSTWRLLGYKEREKRLSSDI